MVQSTQLRMSIAQSPQNSKKKKKKQQHKQGSDYVPLFTPIAHQQSAIEVDLATVMLNPKEGPWRDHGVAKAMVQRSPCALNILSETWGDNKSIVKAAVEMNGAMIEHASTRLRGDPHIALVAACNDPTGSFFHFLSPSAKLIREVVLSAVKDRGSLIRAVDESFLKDREVVFAACMTFPALQYAHEDLRKDQDFALHVAHHCHPAHIGENLQDHVDNETFLKRVVANTSQDDIFLCRVFALSGKAVLTSFTYPARETLDWRVHCLGLIRLFGFIPDKLVTSCRASTADADNWARWAAMMSVDAPFGLRLHELNDIHIMVQ